MVRLSVGGVVPLVATPVASAVAVKFPEISAMTIWLFAPPAPETETVSAPELAVTQVAIAVMVGWPVFCAFTCCTQVFPKVSETTMGDVNPPEVDAPNATTSRLPAVT